MDEHIEDDTLCVVDVDPTMVERSIVNFVSTGTKAAFPNRFHESNDLFEELGMSPHRGSSLDDTSAKHVMFLELESWKKAWIFKEASIFEGVLKLESSKKACIFKEALIFEGILEVEELQPLRVFLKLESWKKPLSSKELQYLRVFFKLESWKKACTFKGASIFGGVLDVGDLEETLYLQRSFNLRRCSWSLGRKLTSSKELQS
ncbi:uncharacterized protein E5676_scaffold306G001520 [Cucumis melo var. makuwa]|uniref:Uncharacterized protein n=1 Tax=Cucumis melo var. makuwa TaxID=1194695 RepID=A0A5D3D3N4_CUCMM|nr:uncharacterized protein E6C27_scaffold67G003630 [Cucumis melo var. makuwa]TYK17876.1 uncharacterized protein E5676_scaffold306G001520 [Cucumis melo var. makuwa]